MEAAITRPAWAEINLDNLANNIREVKRVVRKDALVTAVIKADGYGHGAVEIGETLIENGADRFAVATLSEAIQLRRKFKDIPIMVLGYTPNEFADDVINSDLIQTIYSLEQGAAFSKRAIELGKTVVLHVKLDTGMHRLGFEVSEKAVEDIKEISMLENVCLEGIYTHFAVADEVDKAYTMRQVENYNWIIDQLEAQGLNIPIKHVSNSAAIIDLPELNYNMVRAGIMLYGLYPSGDVNKDNVDLKEVMSLRAKVSHVKTLEEGSGVSYGLKFVAEKKTQVATLPLGYADGFTRMLSGKAKAIIDNTGDIVPVIGRICMDQCMIDATGLEIDRDDTVILFGESNGSRISINEVADALETINYEIVCMINKRIPRVYLKDNKIIKVRDYVLEL